MLNIRLSIHWASDDHDVARLRSYAFSRDSLESHNAAPRGIKCSTLVSHIPVCALGSIKVHGVDLLRYQSIIGYAVRFDYFSCT